MERRNKCFLYTLIAWENIRFSSPFATGTFRADVPPRETSPAAKSVEKRMFSQANTLIKVHDLVCKTENTSPRNQFHFKTKESCYKQARAKTDDKCKLFFRALYMRLKEMTKGN